MSLAAEALCGLSRHHVQQWEDPRFAAHPQVVQAFLAMRAKAAEAGMDLVPVSSFRDFDAQLAIWNKKWRGERPLFDEAGRELDQSLLADEDRIHAILRWSALPGASRHHWGTELDLIDQAAMPEGYRVELLPHEYRRGGVFFGLEKWLAKHAQEFGFFRPYLVDLGGVATEPWHCSYAPLAQEAMESFDPDYLRQLLQRAAIEGQDLILRDLDQLLYRYLGRISLPNF